MKATDLVALVDGNQGLEDRLVLVHGAHRDYVAVRIVRAAFDGDRILIRMEPSLQGVIGVDHGSVEIRQTARQLGGVEFAELRVPRIGDDLTNAREDTDPIAYLSPRTSRQHRSMADAWGGGRGRWWPL